MQANGLIINKMTDTEMTKSGTPSKKVIQPMSVMTGLSKVSENMIPGTTEVRITGFKYLIMRTTLLKQ